MELYLQNNVYFVKGHKNAAIYDTNNNKVYAVDEYGKQIIDNMISGKEIHLEIEKSYLQKLKELDLLTEIKSDLSKEIKIPDSKLIYAWLEITEACNLKCIHCYGKFGQPKINNKKILKTNEWKKIIDKLIKMDCKSIQLIGGEPMIHKDFYEILEYAYTQGIKKIDVFTNGTLINEKSIDIFKRTNANVRVSVYGHNAEIHDKITKIRGSFENNQKALKLLKENNIPTRIAVVVMKENEEYVEEIKRYITELGHIYNGYDVIRQSCATDNKEHSVTNIKLLNSRYNTKAEFWTNHKSFIENHFYNSCWNGKIAITSNGEILPCIFARDEVIGNIRENTDEQLKEKIVQMWKKTKDDVEVCKDCEFRYCCHDCRPLAKAINGKITSKYPRCCYNPYEGIWEKIENCTKEIKNVL